jgi:hypothetical protein
MLARFVLALFAAARAAATRAAAALTASAAAPASASTPAAITATAVFAAVLALMLAAFGLCRRSGAAKFARQLFADQALNGLKCSAVASSDKTRGMSLGSRAA